jgi:hypothetical protein
MEREFLKAKIRPTSSFYQKGTEFTDSFFFLAKVNSLFFFTWSPTPTAFFSDGKKRQPLLYVI